MEIQRFEELTNRIRQLNRVEQLQNALEHVCQEAQLDYYRFVVVVPVSFTRPEVVTLSNYPRGLREKFPIEANLHTDPYLCACAQRSGWQLWENINRDSREDSAQAEMIVEIMKEGLCSGISFPVFSRIGRVSAHFASKQSAFSMRNQLIKNAPHLVALSADIAEKLIEVNLQKITKEIDTNLTAREYECLLWTSEGKTTWETSKILEISERTVIFHLQNISSKLGVSTRPHAVGRAVALDIIKTGQ